MSAQLSSLAEPRTALALPPGAASLASRLAAAALCAAIVLVLALLNPDMQHPFLIPVLACGILLSWDACRWLRGECDLFDSVVIFSLVGMQLWFVAPLLHVWFDYWMPYVDPPRDWRPWLARMAWLNFGGLVIYRTCVAFCPTDRGPRAAQPLFVVDRTRLLIAAGASMALSFVLQAMVYAKFGGISGYVHAFSEGSDQFTGLGFVFMFSESLPIVSLITVVALYGDRPWLRTSAGVLLLILAFITLKLLFGGLRGSRGHFIYGLFWAAALLHYYVRPFTRQFCFVGLIALVVFMYVYGLYKSFGLSAMDVLRDRATRVERMEAAPRSIEAVLLGDLGRSDAQAILLQRMSPESLMPEYRLKYGGTYVGSLAQLIPRRFWPNRPGTKVVAATEILFGPQAYENDIVSTFAFGLTGEAILNFGVLGGLLSFIAIAAVVLGNARWQHVLHPLDSRRLIAPLALTLTYMVPLWDTDVLLFYVVKEGAVPGLVLWFGSRRYLSAAPAAEIAR